MLLRTAINKQDLSVGPERRVDIDLVRAAALAVVVVGHLLMGLVAWQPDKPMLGNLLASSVWLQGLTWLLQVMPIFFLAGGAANYLSWESAKRKGTAYPDWMWRRASRLLAPVISYLSVILPVGAAVTAFTPAGYATPLLSLSTQLLWFLAIYLVITALTPLIASGHTRRPNASLIGWLLVVFTADAVRFAGGPAAIGLINFIAGWAFAAQLGVRLLGPSGSLARFGGVLGISANALLVGLGPYPISLVGMPGDDFSNMAPPSLVMALHALVLYSIWSLARPKLSAIASRPRVWRWTVTMNISAMTVYLWHLPAIVLVTTLLHFAGADRPVSVNGIVGPAAGFWPASLPLFVLSPALIYGLVQVLWGLEQLRLPAAPSQLLPIRLRTSGAAVGAAVTGVGLLLLSAVGPAEFPTGVMEFSGLTWTNGFAAAMTGLGGAVLWAASGRSR